MRRSASLKIDHVTKRFGGVIALNDVSFDVTQGEIHGLIGPNGAGKTTLFNLITGIYSPTEGKIELNGRSLVGMSPHQTANLGIARTFQNIRLFDELSVYQNLITACQKHLSYHHAVIGSCGKVLIRAVAHGKAAHAAEAESGINAINEMSKFLSVLERVPLQTSEVMPAQPYITLRVRGGSNRYSMVVPDSCEALISKHTVPGETPEKIIVDLQSAVQREKLHASFEFAVEKPFYPSFLLNDNLEEICRLRHIFEEVTGEELKLVCSDGVSDNNHWSTIGGIPSVCFGPGGKGLHQSDEWVSTEQMENVLEVYLRFFLEDEE